MNSTLARLCGAGLALVPIPPKNGKPTKAPTSKNWNQPKSTTNPGGYSSRVEDFAHCQGFNFGLYHGASNTVALDLDDLEQAKLVFAEAAGVHLIDWFNDPQRFEIKSPKANRGKLLFKLPRDLAGTKLRQFKHQNKVIFELRSGNCQDVIWGRHPEGGNYQFFGNPAALPEIPAVLLDMLQHWDAWKPCLDSALGIEPPPVSQAPPKPPESERLPGRRDPILEFNQLNGVTGLLILAGYTPVGRNRFLRPGSESQAPGAVILRNCEDGKERVYSHGGDVLNDGYAHDAFDCYRLLFLDGDWGKALAWNTEINQHNQRLYRQEQDRIKIANVQFETPLLPVLPPPPPPVQVSTPQLFPLVRASELTAQPMQIEWLLENILEQGSLNLLFGEPGAGKSLFALDWAFCIAAGMAWYTYRTQPTDVVVVAGEGYAGMARRLKALEQKYQRKASERLLISQRPAQLLDENQARWVAETIKALCPNPGLIIIDTLHRNMEGDENSSQDIGKFISHMDQYMKPLGAAVLIVHHSGHNDKQRSRGSSSIRAAMDGEFSATKNEDGITLTCHKAKDFEALKPLQFTLKPTELDWPDSDGEPMTSVYLEFRGDAILNPKRCKLNARERAILTSLEQAIADYGIALTEIMNTKMGGGDQPLDQSRKVVLIEHWREKAYAVIETEGKTEDARRVAFTRCREKLVKVGLTFEYGDHVGCTDKAPSERTRTEPNIFQRCSG
ncbi:MAG: AAA family ATPase [Methylomicrobium sp.]